MITMVKGAALFDGVAISGTEAQVRAGGQRWVPGPMRGGGGGGGLGRRLCCAQLGGVVWMRDGAVTFKGGTITNTKAVGAHCASCAVAYGYWMPHVAKTTPRGVRRALRRNAGLDGPFELCVVCRGSHAGVWDRLQAARRLSVHTLLHRMFWCSVADDTLLGASMCGPAWVRMQ